MDSRCGGRIHQGDSYKIYLDYYVNGEPIQNEYADVELTISCLIKTGASKEFKFYYSDGSLLWDLDENKFFFRLSQEDSFLFDNEITYQLRLCFPNGDVYAEDAHTEPIGSTLSRTLLNVEE